MNQIESYYCDRCGKFTRHIRMSHEETSTDCNLPWLGRIMGAAADYTGIGKAVDFVFNNYEYKCANCGKQTCRNSQGKIVHRK